MVSNFKQYIIENLSDDEKRELRDLGFGGVNIDTLISEISNKVDDTITLSRGSHDQELAVATGGSVSPDDFGIMHDDIDRDFWYELIYKMDFSSGKMTIDWEITQKDMGLYETGSFTDDMSDHFGDYQSYEDEELAEQIADLLNEATSYGDPTGAMDVMQGVAQEKFERMYGEEDEEEDEEEEVVSVDVLNVDKKNANDEEEEEGYSYEDDKDENYIGSPTDDDDDDDDDDKLDSDSD